MSPIFFCPLPFSSEKTGVCVRVERERERERERVCGWIEE